MPDTRKTVVLSDGGLPSLVCLSIAREEAVIQSGGRGRIAYPMVLAFPPELWADRLRLDSIASQCESMNLPLGTRQAIVGTSSGASDAEIEVGALLASAFAAARLGASKVIWPATSGIGSTVDVDRSCRIQDLAALVGRIVSLDCTDHGHPEFTIEAPLADCSDNRVADLAVDLAVPLDSCWWTNPKASLAFAEHDRWERALQSVGATTKPA